ncbi:hypothetical protein LCGC14_3154650, partial [marine sediment metagenome]
MTPEERKWKAGYWILGLCLSFVIWSFVIGTILRIVEGIA